MKKLFLYLCLILSFTYIYADDSINQKLDEQDKLINEIELQIFDMTKLISSLKLDKANMENHIIQLENGNQKMGDEIKFLKENNDELHIALNSNKEDTHEVINILGDMEVEIAKINKQKELSDKFIQITIPTTTLPLIMSGLYLYFATDEKELGKIITTSGCILLIGSELVWNGGKFILKIW